MDDPPWAARAPLAARADDAAMDVAGPGRRSARRGHAPSARSLPLHRRRAPRRRHDLVRDRRRRRRPSSRFVRRLPAAGRRSPALAHRPDRQARVARRHAAQDAARLRAQPRLAARARRHALPCRRDGATTASPSASASPRRSASARRPKRVSRPSWCNGSRRRPWTTTKLPSPHAERRYRDAGEPATDRPARIPDRLRRFADASIDRLLQDSIARGQALGEVLSEPKPGTWFERSASAPTLASAVVLDAATRMLYDDRHVYINGESFRASGRDATLMRRLADLRCLDAASVARASAGARDLLSDWLRTGWCKACDQPVDEEPT